jgi:hypothetical protein
MIMMIIMIREWSLKKEKIESWLNQMWLRKGNCIARIYLGHKK